MTRVGVTGATGFIGGALVPALADRRYDLVLVDDASGPIRVDPVGYPVMRTSFASEEALRALGACDLVLHLGSASGVMACANDPAGTAKVNVEGTRRLVDACRARKVPVAFASSFAVVGRPERLPVTEETPARPTHEYARQKASGEELVRGLSGPGGASSAVLRMSNVYGTYDARGRVVAKGNVISRFREQVASGRLVVNAPGTQRRDFVHLDDVVRHWIAVVPYLLRADPSNRATFSLASGESYSILELAHLVARLWADVSPTSPPLRVDVVPNPREGVELVDPEFSVDRRATEARLGLRCERTVPETVREILQAAAAKSALGPAGPP